jgi:hypothetical protein
LSFMSSLVSFLTPPTASTLLSSSYSALIPLSAASYAQGIKEKRFIYIYVYIKQHHVHKHMGEKKREPCLADKSNGVSAPSLTKCSKHWP